jgi:tripartite-type tricarboxylate transporter receptor subunit TctC
VPYPAGGPTDQTARVIANLLSKKFNQNFIVENITGGVTIIATNRVAKASPDGYTLLLHNLQISANATLYKNIPFDTAKDLIVSCWSTTVRWCWLGARTCSRTRCPSCSLS